MTQTEGEKRTLLTDGAKERKLLMDDGGKSGVATLKGRGGMGGGSGVSGTLTGLKLLRVLRPLPMASIITAYSVCKNTIICSEKTIGEVFRSVTSVETKYRRTSNLAYL